MGLKRWDNFNKCYSDPEEAGTLKSMGANPNLIVSGQTNLTDTPAKSTEDIMEASTRETSEQLTLLPYQTTTSSVRDFLARVSQLLESVKDSKIREAHYFLRYAESYGLRDLAMYSLRMLKGFCPPTMERPFSPSSDSWMTLGMTVNGRCLTARISVSHKTERGCSLSDILEDNPDQKYFLSERQTQHIRNLMERGEW